MRRIGFFGGSYDEYDPQLQLPGAPRSLEWERLHVGMDEEEMLASVPVDPTLPPQVITVDHPLARDWDYYTYAGWNYGIMSQRLRDAVLPYCRQCFDFWPVTINGVPYFVVRRVGVIDCFDRDNSEFENVADGPDEPECLFIDKYAFFMDRIPKLCLFSIREHRGSLFITNHLVEKLLPLNLTGAFFYDVNKSSDGNFIDWTPEYLKSLHDDDFPTES